MSEKIETEGIESPKWHHPADVMKLHLLKQKKKKLQERIKGNNLNESNAKNTSQSPFENVFVAKKRKNPFVKNSDEKRNKLESPLDESTDQTLFKLLHQTDSNNSNIKITSFDNLLDKLNTDSKGEAVEIVKEQGKKWLPIDWTLKSKIRLLSAEPFAWNNKLKISEEASGITAFTRCLDKNTETNLDTSPNAKFHQCCLFWQQPCLPWVNVFPRESIKGTSNTITMNQTIRDSLYHAWSDSLRSLFQLIRTRQCPYFYACANNFTVLFRAAGICGFSDVHALIAPTTRGFRQALKQEEIEFSTPLKKKRLSDQGYGSWDSNDNAAEKTLPEDEDEDEDSWLKNMGVNDDDIRQINFTQEKNVLKSECEIDNSEQSLVVVEGVEVHAFYNFLINCKTTTALTGHLAGIPPTLLAPVAFQGALLNSLKVRQNKVHVDGCDYHSLEIVGPILPSTIHNLFEINPPEHSMTATFKNIRSTESFSKLENSERPSDIQNKGSVVFGKENLSDCGLLPRILKHFCSPEKEHVSNVECLKYSCEDGTYTWS